MINTQNTTLTLNKKNKINNSVRKFRLQLFFIHFINLFWIFIVNVSQIFCHTFYTNLKRSPKVEPIKYLILPWTCESIFNTNLFIWEHTSLLLTQTGTCPQSCQAEPRVLHSTCLCWLTVVEFQTRAFYFWQKILRWFFAVYSFLKKKILRAFLEWKLKIHRWIRG